MQSDSKRRLAVAIGLVLLLGASVTFWLPLSMDATPDRIDLVLGVLTVATLMVPMLALATPRIDLLSPLASIGIVYAMFYVQRGIHLKHNVLTPAEIVPTLAGEYDIYLGPALELATAGWIAAMVAYLLPLGRAVAESLPRTGLLERDVEPSRAFTVWFIGVGGKALQVARGTHLSFAKPEDMDLAAQGVVDYVSKLSVVGLFVLAALAFRGSMSRRGANFVWAVVLPAELLWGVITGSRFLMIQPLALVLLAYHCFRAPMKARHVLAIALLFALVVTPLGSQLRVAQSELATGEVTEFDAKTTAASARRAGEVVGEQMDEGYMSTALRGTSARMHGVESAMVCLKMTPALVPWADTQIYLLLPAMAFVPRFIWPTKPVMNAVPEFNVRYWGLTRTEAATSVAVSHLGSLFLAFGWWGAVMGMGVLGLFWRVLYEYFRRGGGVAGTVAWLNLLLVIIGIEGDVPAVYSGLFKTVVYVMLVCRFLAPPGLGRTATGQGVQPAPVAASA